MPSLLMRRDFEGDRLHMLPTGPLPKFFTVSPLAKQATSPLMRRASLARASPKKVSPPKNASSASAKTPPASSKAGSTTTTRKPSAPTKLSSRFQGPRYIPRTPLPTTQQQKPEQHLSDPKNLYQVLGVTPTSRFIDPAHAKAVTRLLSLRRRDLTAMHHPDRQGDVNLMSQINHAYDELSTGSSAYHHLFTLSTYTHDSRAPYSIQQPNQEFIARNIEGRHA